MTPGTKLGPYEILSQIGAGGMGEVYRARDPKLGRDVAIKILPDHLADRSELHERFEREARTIASLNHPHICTLYDIGHQDGTDYLVMECLEGETLAQTLTRGPLPLDQVLRYAIEISDALDKAHRKGVTHRDLKPGNIMLTKSGAKLLDFGLAKLMQEASPAAAALSQIPTANQPITAQGTIVGTLQYMAPEQLEGKEADARTDIFAFGAVVYEMATRKKALEGDEQDENPTGNVRVRLFVRLDFSDPEKLLHQRNHAFAGRKGQCQNPFTSGTFAKRICLRLYRLRI